MKHKIEIEIEDERTTEQIARIMRIKIDGWTSRDGTISQFNSVKALTVDNKVISLRNGTPIFTPL